MNLLFLFQKIRIKKIGRRNLYADVCSVLPFLSSVVVASAVMFALLSEGVSPPFWPHPAIVQLILNRF